MISFLIFLHTATLLEILNCISIALKIIAEALKPHGNQPASLSGFSVATVPLVYWASRLPPSCALGACPLALLLGELTAQCLPVQPLVSG